MKTVLITGGMGMIGRALTQALTEMGFNVIILTRRMPAAGSGMRDTRYGDGEKSSITNHGSRNSNPETRITYALWDIEKKIIDKGAVSKADHIIHLAGANFADKRWNEKTKNEIVSSRVDSAKLIIEGLRTIPNKVKTVISASGISWYGADNKNQPGPFSETDPPANDFMATTCKQWEAAIEPASFLGKRLIKFRIGPVLSTEGGAYVEFKNPMRFGLAGIIGNGKQIISWIHIDDLIRSILFAIENEKMEGVYNVVAPKPVSNKELVLKIAKINRGKAYMAVHAPSFALKIVFGEMINEILKSTTVSSAKLQQAGFIFQYEDVDKAVEQLALKS
jgi:uncharacterized protein (TIGR01777 family)